MDYVLFGIQGSGKGTHGKKLAEKLGAAYFETGGELRRLAAENSALGKKVKAIIEAGHLVPNEVVMEIVENFVKRESGRPIIFDGIPRNKEQNDSLEALLKKMGRAYTGIHFELPREEAEQRLLQRRICVNCKGVYPANYPKEKGCEKCGGELKTRADDNAESIRTRFDIFYKETSPVIGDWKSRGKMINVNGAGTIEKVEKELFAKVML